MAGAHDFAGTPEKMANAWRFNLGNGQIFYAIFKRAKTDTFTKSKTKTKTMAPANTQANTQIGSGIISQPQPAKVSALPRSAKEDKTSQRLGCGDAQIRPRARMA
jgi:hypothetical protein